MESKVCARLSVWLTLLYEKGGVNPLCHCNDDIQTWKTKQVIVVEESNSLFSCWGIGASLTTTFLVVNRSLIAYKSTILQMWLIMIFSYYSICLIIFRSKMLAQNHHHHLNESALIFFVKRKKRKKKDYTFMEY